MSLPRFHLFRRPFRLLAGHWRTVVPGVGLVIGAGLCALWLPQLSGQALDLVIGSSDAAPGELLAICGWILLAAVGEAALRFAARRLLINASRRVEEQLKNDILRHVDRLPISWFDRAGTGDLISRLTQDVELLRFLVGPALLYGGAAVVVIPGGLYLMAQLSVSVCLAALVIFGGLVASLTWIMPRLHRDSKAVQESIAAVSQRSAEDFSGIRVLLTFGRAPTEVAAMTRLCGDYLRHNIGLGRTRALFNLAIHTCRELVVLSLLVVGVLEVIAGKMTTGELFEFLMLTGVMVWPLIATSWILGVAQRATAAAERIEELFAADPEPTGGTGPQLTGRLEVRDLTFCYPGSDQPALDHVSFRLEPGQKLGLVGPVGSGKTTLLSLLLRLYAPPAGTIFADGHDVCELSPLVLRRRFAVAPQDAFLFSDTIRGNVAFGTDEKSADVARAVHTSALDQDIDAYPDGLESIVGERGVTLSGGQKQRVSLARALAADRGTLLLDDTLSAVDHGTEAKILDRLRRTDDARTMIVASHRLSAVADADLIVVLDRGRIIERGNHDQLIARGGYYAAAHARQREHDSLGGGDGAV